MLQLFNLQVDMAYMSNAPKQLTQGLKITCRGGSLLGTTGAPGLFQQLQQRRAPRRLGSQPGQCLSCGWNTVWAGLGPEGCRKAQDQSTCLLLDPEAQHFPCVASCWASFVTA